MPKKAPPIDTRPWEVYDPQDPENYLMRSWYKDQCQKWIELAKRGKIRKRELNGQHK